MGYKTELIYVNDDCYEIIRVMATHNFIVPKRHPNRLDKELIKIQQQVEDKQKDFFNSSRGKKLIDDYQNKWNEFSKTEEYKNMSVVERQQALKKLEEDLDKEANILTEEEFKPLLDAYNKRYEIVFGFQPETQVIQEKYSN